MGYSVCMDGGIWLFVNLPNASAVKNLKESEKKVLISSISRQKINSYVRPHGRLITRKAIFRYQWVKGFSLRANAL